MFDFSLKLSRKLITSTNRKVHSTSEMSIRENNKMCIKLSHFLFILIKSVLFMKDRHAEYNDISFEILVHSFIRKANKLIFPIYSSSLQIYLKWLHILSFSGKSVWSFKHIDMIPLRLSIFWPHHIFASACLIRLELVLVLIF